MKPPRRSEIKILTTVAEAEAAAKFILRQELKFCGLDCEWVGKNKTGTSF